jgi:hypothetical protein
LLPWLEIAYNNLFLEPIKNEGCSCAVLHRIG